MLFALLAGCPSVYAATQKKPVQKVPIQKAPVQKTSSASPSQQQPPSSSKEIEARLQKEEKELNKIQNQARTLQKKVREQQKKEQDVIGQLEKLNRQIVVTEQKITVTNLRREKMHGRIGELTQNINRMSSRIEEIKELLRGRLVAVYKYGGIAEFNLLFSAPGAKDALATSYLLGKIANQDRYLIGDLTTKKENLDTSRRELVEQKELLESENQKLKGQKISLEGDTKARNNLLDRVRKEKALHLAELEELERADRELRASIKYLLEQKRKINAQRNADSGETPQYYKKGGRLAWPLRGKINSEFGTRVHPVFRTRTKHTGLDIDGNKGDPIMAALSGEVLYAGWLRGYGQVVILDHGNDLTTVYAHMSKILVSEGAKVSTGQRVGLVGATGVATGNHLHFEVRVNGDAVNPMGYLQ